MAMRGRGGQKGKEVISSTFYAIVKKGKEGSLPLIEGEKRKERFLLYFYCTEGKGKERERSSLTPLKHWRKRRKCYNTLPAFLIGEGGKKKTFVYWRDYPARA